MPYLWFVQHSHNAQTDRSSAQLLTAFVLNFFFALIEIVGGFLTNSVAVLSDALHDLGDSLALGTAWYFERISRRGRDDSHTYGYRRYSVLGAIINAVVLISGSVFVIIEAASRLRQPEEVHAGGMILLAILGIIINGFAFSRLHAGHSHNIDVVKWHLLEDVLGWITVLIGAIAIRIWSVYILDPILSLLVSIWILYQVIRRLMKSLRIILQNTPTGISTESVDGIIRSLPEVLTTHDTHLWTMDGEYHILTVHVVLREQQTMIALAGIKDTIRHKLQALHINHATIEFEFPEEGCAFADC